MATVTGLFKRLLLGRARRSEELGETLLPKRLALPVFASDPLSSVAYATQEILLVLTLGGLAYVYVTPYLAAGVIGLMTVVVLSYRQVVYAYPSGGGSYEVVSTNLGPSAGLVVAAALLVDYVMTVAVSVASGVDNVISALPALAGHRVLLALCFVALLTAMNLRGVRESGRAFAAPTYLFVGAVLIMVGTGLIRYLMGDAPVAESARYGVEPTPGSAQLTGLALVMLVLRAFSSGCTALTGVEAISNGVPAFRRPKPRNAAATLAAMGAIAVAMFAGVTTLAIVAKVHIVQDPCRLIGLADCAGYTQRTVIAQLASSVFGGSSSVGFFVVQAATALVLILAANTAFNGFPLLASILAQDRYLPTQLHSRGDRLVYSNGILVLAVVAGALLFGFKADVTSLIHLYILGVFTSFTLSQTGMVRHWNRALRTDPDPARRRRCRLARVVNAAGALVTGLVLVIVLATKFLEGAWLAVLAAVVLWLMMRAIRRHYDAVAAELTVTDPRADLTPPPRVLALVLVSDVHKPTLRALAYARAFHPDRLQALTVDADRAATARLEEQWARLDTDIPLTVIDSPYREITGPVVEYVRHARRTSPRDVVGVFIPEYVVGRWWENLLHNQTALWLKSRLLFTPGVMVTSVPWQLTSSAHVRPTVRGAGAVRRGVPATGYGIRRPPRGARPGGGPGPGGGAPTPDRSP